MVALFYIIGYLLSFNLALTESVASKSTTQFGFDVYKQLVKNGEDENIFFSPASLHCALSMLYAGANSTTAGQMHKILHDQRFNVHEMYKYWLKVLREEGSGKNHTVLITNRIFVQKGNELKSDYLKTLALNYGSRPELLDFQKQAELSRLKINSWFVKNTRGKISKEFLPQGSVHEQTKLVLANALYFKALWLTQFQRKDTKLKPFHLNKFKTVQVPTMTAKMPLKTGRFLESTIIEIPYTSDIFSMIIILPDEVDGLEKLTEKLNAETLANAIQTLKEKHVSLHLPKFKLDTTMKMKNALKSLGMPDAFSSAKADFSGINGKRDLFVDEVYHGAMLQVNEEGTEAAAATGVLAMVRSMVVGKNEVVVDRPFLFVLSDREFGMPLFMGRVQNPENED